MVVGHRASVGRGESILFHCQSIVRYEQISLPIVNNHHEEMFVAITIAIRLIFQIARLVRFRENIYLYR